MARRRTAALAARVRSTRGDVRQLAILFGLVAGLAPAIAVPAAMAAPAWLQPALDVSVPDVWGDTPDVATDPAGDTIAVWQGFDGSAYTIMTSFRPAGGAFSTPAPISLPGFSDEPHVALDQDGNAVAVWHYTDGSVQVIQASVRPAHGAFGAPITLSGDGQHFVPRIAMNRAGDAVIAWQRLAGDRFAQVSIRPRGGTFSEAQTLSGSGVAADARPAIDPAGNVVVVWDQTTGGARTVQASVRPAGGGFSAPVDVSAGGPDAFAPHVAMDQAGNAIVAWEQEGALHMVEAALRLAGGSFSAPVTLSDASRNAVQPRIDMNPAGDTVVAWSRSNGSEQIVQAALRPPGGFFAKPVDLSEAGHDASDPQVAIDAAGNVTAAWTRNNGSNDVVQASLRPAGGTFAPATSLSAPGQNAADPQIETDENGNAVTLWKRYSGLRDVIQAAAYSASGPQLSAVDVPATAPVATPVAFAVSPLAIWSSVAATDWTFGDGGSASGTNVSHTFATPGSYEVVITATSVVGGTSTARRAIVIAPPPPPPPPPPGPCTDCDADGYPAAVDCSDGNNAIHPGAVDKPGNKIDENCDGHDEPYPLLGSKPALPYQYTKGTHVVHDLELTVSPAIAGSTVRLSCTGGRTPCRRFKPTTRHITKNARIRSFTALMPHTLRPGARFEVRVTKPGFVGRVIVLTVFARKPATRVELCLMPGSTKPASCPASA
jgi:PKD repeat protein